MIAKRCLLLYLVATPLFAVDLGSFGKTYPIAETPFDTFIQQHLNHQSLKKEQIEKHFIAQTQNRLMRPQGVHLPKATQNASRLFNPTIHFKQAIQDDKQNTIVPAGKQINPLAYVSLTKPLVFFDGDDAVQTAWVKKHHVDDTLILVKGEPLTLQTAWQRKIYFDQQAKLVDHFSLKALPCVITQKGEYLRIQECVPT